jgi:hypothetical protein
VVDIVGLSWTSSTDHSKLFDKIILKLIGVILFMEIGQKINRLTLIGSTGTQDKRKAKLYWFECDCINKTIITSVMCAIESGSTKSCGCLQKEKAAATFKKYNETNNPLKVGEIHDRLTLLEIYATTVLVQCSCKDKTIKEVSRDGFRRTGSCGCLVREHAASIAVAANKVSAQKNKGRSQPKTRGENHYNWKGGVSLNHTIRNTTKYREWRMVVFIRDSFRCVKCNHGGNVHAHHIIEVSDLLKQNNIKTVEEAEACEAFWDTSNGITVCTPCHSKIHGRPVGTKINGG